MEASAKDAQHSTAPLGFLQMGTMLLLTLTMLGLAFSASWKIVEIAIARGFPGKHELPEH